MPASAVRSITSVQSGSERPLRSERSQQMAPHWGGHEDGSWAGLPPVQLVCWGRSKYGLDHRTTVPRPSVCVVTVRLATGCNLCRLLAALWLLSAAES